MSFTERIKNDINGFTPILFKRKDRLATRVFLYLPFLSNFMYENEFTLSEENSRNTFFHKDMTKDMSIVEVDVASKTVTNKPHVLLLKKVNESGFYGMIPRKGSGTGDCPETSPLMNSNHHLGVDSHFINPLAASDYADYLINNRKAVSNFLDLIYGASITTGTKESPSAKLVLTGDSNLESIYRVPLLPVGVASGLMAKPLKNSVFVSNLSTSGPKKYIDQVFQFLPMMVASKAILTHFKRYEKDLVDYATLDDSETFVLNGKGGVFVPTMFDIDSSSGKPMSYEYGEHLGNRLTDWLPFRIDTGVYVINRPTLRYETTVEDATKGEGWHIPTRSTGGEVAHLSRDRSNFPSLKHTVFDKFNEKLFMNGTPLHAFMEVEGRVYWNEDLDKTLANRLYVVGRSNIPPADISVVVLTEKPLSIDSSVPFSPVPYIDVAKPAMPVISQSSRGVHVVHAEEFFERYLNSATSPIDPDVLDAKQLVDSLFYPIAHNELDIALTKSTAFNAFNIKALIETDATGNDLFTAVWDMYVRFKGGPTKRHLFNPHVAEVLDDVVTDDGLLIKAVLGKNIQDEVHNINTFTPKDIEEANGAIKYQEIVDDSGKSSRFITAVMVTGILSNVATNERQVAVASIGNKKMENIPEMSVSSMEFDDGSIHSAVDRFFGDRFDTSSLSSQSATGGDPELIAPPYKFTIRDLEDMSFSIDEEKKEITLHYPYVTSLNGEDTVVFEKVVLSDEDLAEDYNTTAAYITQVPDISEWINSAYQAEEVAARFEWMRDEMAKTLANYQELKAQADALVADEKIIYDNFIKHATEEGFGIMYFLDREIREASSRAYECERMALYYADMERDFNDVLDDPGSKLLDYEKYVDNGGDESALKTLRDKATEAGEKAQASVSEMNALRDKLKGMYGAVLSLEAAISDATKRYNALVGVQQAAGELVAETQLRYDHLVIDADSYRQVADHVMEYIRDYLTRVQEGDPPTVAVLKLRSEAYGRIFRIAKFIRFQVLYMLLHRMKKEEFTVSLRKFYRSVGTAEGKALARFGITGTDFEGARKKLEGEYKNSFPTVGNGLYPIVEEPIDFYSYTENIIPTNMVQTDSATYDKMSALYSKYIRVPLYGKAIILPHHMKYKLRYKGERKSKDFVGSTPVVFDDFADLSDSNEEIYEPLNRWPAILLNPEGMGKADLKEDDGKKLSIWSMLKTLWKKWTDTEDPPFSYDVLMENYKGLKAMSAQDVVPFKEMTDDPDTLTDEQLEDLLIPYKIAATVNYGKLQDALGGSDGCDLGVSVGIVSFMKREEGK